MSVAVRSNDLQYERWDLLSGAACRELFKVARIVAYDHEPVSLVGLAIEGVQKFLGCEANNDAYRLELLTEGWGYLATAIQKLDMPPGELCALKSHLRYKGDHFHHYPFYALKRLARTCYEGAEKYAEENWHNGFELKGLANHTIAHMISWSNGRTPLSKFWKYGDGKWMVEDELGHAMWGFQAMTHVWLFRQDKCKLLLGRNYSITEELKKYHDEHASRRQVVKTEPKSELPGDRYWDDILQKEEETRKRVMAKDLLVDIWGVPERVPNA